MTQDFAEGFVDLRCLGFASQTVTKFRLDDAEGGFNVAPLVVLLQEPPLIEFVIMIHLPPKGAFTLPLRFLVLSLAFLIGPIRMRYSF